MVNSFYLVSTRYRNYYYVRILGAQYRIHAYIWCSQVRLNSCHSDTGEFMRLLSYKYIVFVYRFFPRIIVVGSKLVWFLFADFLSLVQIEQLVTFWGEDSLFALFLLFIMKCFEFISGAGENLPLIWLCYMYKWSGMSLGRSWLLFPLRRRLQWEFTRATSNLWTRSFCRHGFVPAWIMTGFCLPFGAGPWILPSLWAFLAIHTFCPPHPRLMHFLVRNINLYEGASTLPDWLSIMAIGRGHVVTTGQYVPVDTLLDVGSECIKWTLCGNGPEWTPGLCDSWRSWERRVPEVPQVPQVQRKLCRCREWPLAAFLIQFGVCTALPCPDC